MPEFIKVYGIFLIELISFYLLGCRLKNRKIKLNSVLIISLATVSAISTGFQLLIPNNLVCFLLQTVLYVTFIALVFKVAVHESIFIYFFIFLLNMTIQFISFLPYQLIVRPEQPTEFASLLGILITLICCILIYFFVPLNVLYTYLSKSSFILQILIINTCIIYAAVVLFFRFTPSSPIASSLLAGFILLTAAIVNCQAFFSHMALTKKSRELDSYKIYLPIVEELIDQVRIRQHNYDNEIQSICSLPLTCKTYDELTDALNRQIEVHNASCIDANLLKISHKLLSGFLYSKITEAKNKGINIQLSIEEYCIQTRVLEYELVEMCGILIDNAIEATAPGESIYVFLNSANSRFIFTVENPSAVIDAEKQLKMFQKNYTTKSSENGQRGLGLYILKKNISEYNGAIVLENKNVNGKNFVSIQIEV